MKILLIDDDAVDRKAVRRALKDVKAEIDIREVADGRAGVALMQREAFDCVLLDYLLPDMDGIAVVNELQPDDGPVRTPIVMLTGKGNETIAVEAMKSGIQDYLPKDVITSTSLIRAIRNAIDKIHLRRQLEEARHQIKQMALYDTLSELGNRNLFSEELSQYVSASARRKTSFCLFMMDLNKFKPVNDQLGHEAGDAVIGEVGRRLKYLGRDADMFFRLGGDEFAAIVETGETGNIHEGVDIFAQKIIDELNEPFLWNGHTCRIGVSIGISVYPEHGSTGDDLLRRADAAMYAAKRGDMGFIIASSGIKSDVGNLRVNEAG